MVEKVSTVIEEPEMEPMSMTDMLGKAFKKMM